MNLYKELISLLSQTGETPIDLLLEQYKDRNATIIFINLRLAHEAGLLISRKNESTGAILYRTTAQGDRYATEQEITKRQTGQALELANKPPECKKRKQIEPICTVVIDPLSLALNRSIKHTRGNQIG